MVDGTVTPDFWVISRGEPLTILQREIRDKGQKAVCLPEEGVRMQADAQGTEAALTDAQALELARIALVLESHFKGAPGYRVVYRCGRDASLSSRAGP